MPVSLQIIFKVLTGLYSGFASRTPFVHKANLVRSLAFGAFHNLTSYLNVHNELTRTKRILKSNRFLISLIYRASKSFLDNKLSSLNKIQNINDNQTPLFFNIPSLGPSSFNLK